MNPVDPHPVHVGQGFNIRVGGQKRRLEASHLAGGCCLSFDGLAADDPPHGRVEAEPPGNRLRRRSRQGVRNGLAKLPGKTVATVLPSSGVGEHVPGNLGQSESIIQFPVRQQPSVGSDLGTVELKLEPTVKIQPQNPTSRFTRRVSHINTQNPPVTI